MDSVANWVRDEASGAAEGSLSRQIAAHGVLALSLALMAAPPLVAVLALLRLIS
ncbi:MAG TPA: hypothetical protein VGE99_01200 [Candidatus Dormibacteraeota bacterium]